ncbi:collagen, type I, alpha 1b-like [Caloenas nicobarica]|uniref:collagen, type I, alpha 1b-like n=1 Tax=Caloenas nicobarica TaxID=187106 RepID=UPI0032B81BE5
MQLSPLRDARRGAPRHGGACSAGRPPAPQPPRRGGHRAGAAGTRRGCRRPLRRAGEGGSGGSPAPRGRRAAVRVSGAAALLAPNGRGGLTDGHVPAPAAAGRRGGGPRGSAAGGGEQRPRAPAGEADPKVSASPPPEVGSRHRKKRAARLQRGGSAYLCLGAEGGPGSVAPPGPASRVTPPSAGLRGRAAELVRARRRSGAGSARRPALRLGGLGARSKGGFSLLHAASREASPGLSQHFPAVSDTPLYMKRIIQPGSRTRAQKKLN